MASWNEPCGFETHQLVLEVPRMSHISPPKAFANAGSHGVSNKTIINGQV
jgi:hypothetical protein